MRRKETSKSGISGNDGTSAGGRSQLGARDVKMLICETNFSGSSRLEAESSVTPGMAAAVVATFEPHTGQNRRVIG